jgi:hypothetical protein
MEVCFVEELRPTNDDPVISKEETALSCDERDGPQIAEAKLGDPGR